MHERIRYSCDKCDYTRTQVKNLKEHIKTKHNGAPVIYVVILLALLGAKTHILSKHEAKRHFCDKWDFAATSVNGLKKHLKKKHEGITFLCDKCDYVSTTARNLITH